MANKTFYLKLGTGNPANYTGLSPTFIIFNSNGLTALAAPGITEAPIGSGIYNFMYGPTLSILFQADGGAALSATDRYIVGALDPIQAVDQQVGFVTDSFGSTAQDPITVFGKLNRNQEFQEGAKIYTKATGIWDVYSRGQSMLLTEKILTNTSTLATSN